MLVRGGKRDVPTLTHLALHVPDLDACIAFYETFCGMRVIHRRPGKGSQIVWMAEPGQEQRFIFVIMPGGQPATWPATITVISASPSPAAPRQTIWRAAPRPPAAWSGRRATDPIRSATTAACAIPRATM